MEKCYHSLEEVRLHIDQVDEQLITLLSRRQELVEQAVHFKKEVAEAAAPDRVEAVIKKVRSYALTKGLDTDIAETVYRVMISCFIQKEQKEIQPNRTKQ